MNHKAVQLAYCLVVVVAGSARLTKKAATIHKTTICCVPTEATANQRRYALLPFPMTAYWLRYGDYGRYYRQMTARERWETAVSRQGRYRAAIHDETARPK